MLVVSPRTVPPARLFQSSTGAWAACQELALTRVEEFRLDGR